MGNIETKNCNSSSNILNIGAYIAACAFNEGTRSLLMIANSLGMNCGPNAHRYADKIDAECIRLVNKRAEENTRGDRMQRRQQQIEVLQDCTSTHRPRGVRVATQIHPLQTS